MVVWKLIDAFKGAINHPNQQRALHFRKYTANDLLNLLEDEKRFEKVLEDYLEIQYTSLVTLSSRDDQIAYYASGEGQEVNEPFFRAQITLSLYIYEVILYPDWRNKKLFKLDHVHGNFEEFIDGLKSLIMKDEDDAECPSSTLSPKKENKKKDKNSKQKGKNSTKKPKETNIKSGNYVKVVECGADCPSGQPLPDHLKSTRKQYLKQIKEILKKIIDSVDEYKDVEGDRYEKHRQDNPELYEKMELTCEMEVELENIKRNKILPPKYRHLSEEEQTDLKRRAKHAFVMDGKIVFPVDGYEEVKYNDQYEETNRFGALTSLIKRTMSTMNSAGPYEDITKYEPSTIRYTKQNFGSASPKNVANKEAEQGIKPSDKLVTPPPEIQQAPVLERQNSDKESNGSETSSSNEGSYDLSSAANSELNCPTTERNEGIPDGEKEEKKTEQLTKGQKKNRKKKMLKEQKKTHISEILFDSVIDSPSPQPSAPSPQSTVAHYEVLMEELPNETIEEKEIRQSQKRYTSEEMLVLLKDGFGSLKSIYDVNVTQAIGMITAVQIYQEKTTTNSDESLNSSQAMSSTTTQDSDPSPKKKKSKTKKAHSGDRVEEFREEFQQSLEIIKSQIKELQLSDQTSSEVKKQTSSNPRLWKLMYYKDLNEARLKLEGSFKYIREDNSLYNDANFPNSLEKREHRILYDPSGNIWKLVKENYFTKAAKKAKLIFLDIVFSGHSYKTIINYENIDLDRFPIFPLKDDLTNLVKSRLLDFDGGDIKFRKYRKWIRDRFEQMSKTSNLQIPAKFATYKVIKDDIVMTVAGDNAFDRMFYSLFCIVSYEEFQYIPAFEIVYQAMDSLRLYVQEDEDEDFHQLFQDVTKVKNNLKQKQFDFCKKQILCGDIDINEIMTIKDWVESRVDEASIKWYYDLNRMLREDRTKAEAITAIISKGQILPTEYIEETKWLKILEYIGIGQKNPELLFLNPNLWCTKDDCGEFDKPIIHSTSSRFVIGNVWTEGVQQEFKKSSDLALEIIHLKSSPDDRNEFDNLKMKILCFNEHVTLFKALDNYYQNTGVLIGPSLIYAHECPELASYFPCLLPAERSGVILYEQPVKDYYASMLNYQVGQAFELMARFSTIRFIEENSIGAYNGIERICKENAKTLTRKFNDEFGAEHKDKAVALAGAVSKLCNNLSAYHEAIEKIWMRFETYTILTQGHLDMDSFIFEESSDGLNVMNVVKITNFSNIRYVPVGVDMAMFKYGCLRKNQPSYDIFYKKYAHIMNKFKRKELVDLTEEIVKEIVDFCSPYASFLAFYKAHLKLRECDPTQYWKLSKKVVEQAGVFIEVSRKHDIAKMLAEIYK